MDNALAGGFAEASGVTAIASGIVSGNPMEVGLGLLQFAGTIMGLGQITQAGYIAGKYTVTGAIAAGQWAAQNTRWMMPYLNPFNYEVRIAGLGMNGANVRVKYTVSAPRTAQYAEAIGPGIGRSNFRTMGEFADAVAVRYQQLYNNAYADTMALVRQGLVRNNRRTIGSRVDDIARTELRDWLRRVEGIEEGPGQLIQVNRRLYDPSGSGRYRIPDVYIPGAGSILDGTIAPKTSFWRQIIDFRAFSGGGNVTVIRPSVETSGGIRGSYGILF